MYTKDEIKEIKDYAVKHICPHYSVNVDLDKNPKVYVKSDVNYIYDIEGNKYLDTFGSLLTTICGHNNMYIIDAIYDQIKILDFFPNFGDHYCLPMVELSKKLEKITPEGLTAFFYVNSGSEANETALKVARAYHVERGEPQRYKIVSRRGSYHGTTIAATSVTGIPYFYDKYEPMENPGLLQAPAANCAHCELGLKYETCGLQCLKEFEKVIEDNDPKTISAVIMDPLPGSNTGYPVPPEGYLQGVRDLCTKHGIILIFDEIQTGFGKSGEMFVSQYFGVTPDIMTVAKAITNGYIPLGATIMRQDIYDLFRSEPGKEFVSGSTFGGHNVACAAAIATLEYLEDNDLLNHAKEISQYIHERIEKLMEKYPFIARISGIGLLLAVELSPNRETLEPFEKPGQLGNFIREYSYQHGLIVRNNTDIVVIAPPLSFTKEEVDIMMDTFDDAFAEAVKKFDL